jgi:hypothetical protein
MNFWEKIENDIKKNIKEGLDIFMEGSATVSKKIELLTEEGKKKFKIFNLNTKVQDEFTKLGGQIYDLISKESKTPLANKKVTATIKRIKRLEKQIIKLELQDKPKPAAARKKKTVKKKAVKKKTAGKKPAGKKK